MLYRIINNAAVPWTGGPINGVRYPLSIEYMWDATILIPMGLYSVLDADPIPAGKQAITTTVQIVNGVPKYVDTLVDIPIPVPSDYPLTARQLRLGLVRNNVSLSRVTDAITSLPTQQLRDEAMIYWEYSSIINWEHPMTQTLLGLVGISIDNAKTMWMIAKDYEA